MPDSLADGATPDGVTRLDPALAAPPLDPALAARVADWVAGDVEPADAHELDRLLAAARAGSPGATADLADRFRGPLEFGTAGLRGRLGAGETRMNRAVVVRAAAGLVAFLAEAVGDASGGCPGEGAGAPRVVIGYDARRGSHRFALDTAGVVTAAGGTALLLPRALPTPVLAFAVRHLGADAGVMVTASHNPAADNGYKVYLGGRVERGPGRGAQIVSPADADIAARIAAVGPAVTVPRSEQGWQVLGEDVVAAYLDRIAATSPPLPSQPPPSQPLRIALTPLHGVGGEFAVAALRRAGYGDLHVVAEQARPDPAFPTVAFPNPEEPGALDLLLGTARQVQADLALALDPDADRCAVAIPGPDGRGWTVLTGDDVGALLGEQAAARAAGTSVVLASSVVSSRLLGRIAHAHGLEHRTTLTGFKWIARTPGLAFGYEEALGYCVDPPAVADKDGIAAAVRVATLAAERRAAGSDLAAMLDDLARRHGVHATAQVSVRCEDLARIERIMARLRADPPGVWGGRPVARVEDLATPTGDLPATDALVYLTDRDDRVVVRPSGTEPKLKVYLEAVVPVSGGDVAAARAVAADRLTALRADAHALTTP